MNPRAHEQSAGLRRLPVAYFAAVYAEHLLGIAGLALATVISSQQSVSWVGDWAWTIIGLLLCARIAQPFYSWSSLRFSYASDGVLVSTGIVNRRTRFAAWSSVAAVQVDQPWCYRIFGLSRVTLLQGGDDATRIGLPGLDSSTASELVRLAQRSTTAAVRQSDQSTEPTTIPIYKASISDLLIASLIYGKFATLGIAGALTALDAMEISGLTQAASEIAAAGPFIVGSAVALSIMAAGALATVVRFAGLETVLRGATLVLRYGLFSTRERAIAADAIVGIELRRNLLEIALGRVRLSLITMDSASRLGSNLVLPSLREEMAARIIAESSFHHVVNHAWIPFTRRKALVTGALTLGATLVATAIGSLIVVGVFENRLVYGVATFAVLFVGLHWIGSVALAHFHFDSEARSVSIATAYISVRQRILDVAFIHLVSTVSLGHHPVIVRVHYYAGIPRVLTAVQFESAQVRSLARSFGRRSEGNA